MKIGFIGVGKLGGGVADDIGEADIKESLLDVQLLHIREDGVGNVNALLGSGLGTGQPGGCNPLGVRNVVAVGDGFVLALGTHAHIELAVQQGGGSVGVQIGGEAVDTTAGIGDGGNRGLTAETAGIGGQRKQVERIVVAGNAGGCLKLDGNLICII